jgi:hypothetical protein
MTHYKFHYYGERSKAYANIITVATVKDGNTIKCGISFCNKKDKYVKRVGRFLAIEKLHTIPIVIDISERIILDDIGLYQYIHMLVASHIATTKSNVPSWAPKVVEYDYYNYLYYFGMDDSEFELPNYDALEDDIVEFSDDINFGYIDLTYKPSFTQRVGNSLRKLFGL